MLAVFDWAAVALVFFLALSSALDLNSEIQREACKSLTEYHINDVPQCESVEACRAKVRQAFNLEEVKLSGELEEKVFEWENSMTHAWRNFGLARKKAEQVLEYCQTTENKKPLSSQKERVMDLSNDLIDAFGHAERARNEMVEIVALASRGLEEQEIELAYSEPLYLDFKRVKANLQAWQEENPNSNTFAGRSLRLQAELLAVREELGEVAFIGEGSLFETAASLLEESNKDLKKLFSLFGQAEDDRKVVSALERFDASALFKNLNQSIGSCPHCVSSQFAGLLVDLSKNLAGARAMVSELEKDCGDNLEQLETGLEGLQGKSLAFKESQGLETAVCPELDLETLPEEGLAFAQEKRKAVARLLLAHSLEEASLGRTLSGLKGINLEILSELECLAFVEEKSADGVVEVDENVLEDSPWPPYRIELKNEGALFVESGRLAMKRELAIKIPDGFLPLVLVETNLLSGGKGVGQVKVYHENREIDFVLLGNNLSFSLENAEDKEVIEIYYSIEEAVRMTREESEIEVENRVPFELEDVSFCFPLAPEGVIESLQLTDEGAKVNFEISSERLCFKLKSLKPWEVKRLDLFLQVKPVTVDWEKELAEMEAIARQALDLNREGLAKNALALREGLANFSLPRGLVEAKDFEEFNRLKEKASLLRLETEKFLAAQKNFLEQRDWLEAEFDRLEGNAGLLEGLGFAKESQALEKSLVKAEKYWLAGIEKGEKEDFEAAEKEFLKAREALTQEGLAEPIGLLRAEKEALKAEAEALWRGMPLLYPQEKITAFTDSIESLEASFDLNLFHEDFQAADESLTSMRERLASIEAAFAEDLKAWGREAKARISSYFALQDDKGVAKRLSTLKKMIESGEKNPLALDFALPLGLEGIDRLSERLESLKAKANTLQLNQVVKAIDKGEHLQALEAFKPLEEDFEKAFQEIGGIAGEVDAALSLLREEAVERISLAEKEAEGLPEAHLAQGKELVAQARQSFGAEKYLDAMKYAHAVTGLASLPAAGDFPIPWAILPFLALVAVAGAMRLKGKPVERPKKLVSFRD